MPPRPSHAWLVPNVCLGLNGWLLLERSVCGLLPVCRLVLASCHGASVASVHVVFACLAADVHALVNRSCLFSGSIEPVSGALPHPRLFFFSGCGKC